MRIGKWSVQGYAALAPMAGVADRAMRELCREFGASYTVGELVSAKGVSLQDKKSAQLLKVGEAERPMGLQLFGNDPRIMAQAALEAARSKPDFIDINMGCPAPKVAANGGGCAMMRDPELAGRVVEAVVKALSPDGPPVTVKLRAGWDAQTVNAVQVARRCEEAGAAAITVHGRTREQMYAPPVDFDIIRAVKRAVGVPVIGNGDIDSGERAVRMYRETGCDFIMVGRAAMGAPWVFRQINAFLSSGEVLPAPPVEMRMELLLEQVRRMEQYKGAHIAFLEARKHAAWYMRGLRGAASLRRECGEMVSMDGLRRLVEKALSMNL